MKPSFNIGARNGLLEQKHIEALGAAVWLYLWFIDKQPKDTDRVLGGQPITYEHVVQALGVTRRTYTRWLSLLQQGGYIATLRTPRGLVVTINKPKKWIDAPKMANQNDKPKMAHRSKSDAPNLSSDAPKSVSRYAESGASNIKETKTINNKQSITNVIGDSPRYGKTEINDMFDFWEEQVGIQISSRTKMNRNACNNLIKKHGEEKVKMFIKGVALSHTDKFAPRISDFISLQSKLTELLVWGKGRMKNAPAKF